VLVTSDQLEPDCTRYLNRLSDFLFAAARTAAMAVGASETEWQKANEPPPGGE